MKSLIWVLLLLLACNSQRMLKTRSGPTSTEKEAPGDMAEKKATEVRENPLPLDLTLDKSDGPDDGRFTLGVRGERIMYGYPVPLSTSHFVLRVGERFASNYAGLGIPHIKSERKTVTHEGVPATEARFRYHGIELIQRLIPLNKERTPESDPAAIQYYRIAYEIRNQHAQPQKAGLMLLIDTMIADNDAAPVQHSGRVLTTEGKYEDNSVPDEVLVYKAGRDLSQLTGQMFLKSSGATAPDSFFVGRWPVFHSAVWDISPLPVVYGDSAVVLRWSPQSLAAGQERNLSTIYGIHPRSGSGLRALYNTPSEQKRIALFFDSGSSRLSEEGKEEIRNFLREHPPNKVLGVVAEAGADAPGSDRENFQLSRRRAEAVRAYLGTLGIATTHVIPKPFGDSRASKEVPREKQDLDLPADLLYYARKEAKRRKVALKDHLQKILEDRYRRAYGIREWGNPEDRRVDLIFFIESGR